jgi:glucan endo-1,3-alpha-glucosidase
MSLPADRAPEIIQVISWNDYGESHHIAPVLGAEPGSQAWTANLSHEAFRLMVRYFANRWRSDSVPEVDSRLIVWAWYRTHPASANASNDPVGRPAHAEWVSLLYNLIYPMLKGPQAVDQINLLILVPASMTCSSVTVKNGGRVNVKPLYPGRANSIMVPFIPGSVSFEIPKPDGKIWVGQGVPINERPNLYNFNMWGGSWGY